MIYLIGVIKNSANIAAIFVLRRSHILARTKVIFFQSLAADHLALFCVLTGVAAGFSGLMGLPSGRTKQLEVQ